MAYSTDESVEMSCKWCRSGVKSIADMARHLKEFHGISEEPLKKGDIHYGFYKTELDQEIAENIVYESYSKEYDPSGEPDIISEDDQKLLDYFNHIEGKEAYGEREEYETLKNLDTTGMSEEEIDDYYERLNELRISLGESKGNETHYDTADSWWNSISNSDKTYVLNSYISNGLTGMEDGLDWTELRPETQEELTDYFGEKIFSEYHGEATGLDDPWTRGMSDEEKKAYNAIDSGDCCETPEDIDRLADREGISRDVAHKVFNNNFSYEGESYAKELESISDDKYFSLVSRNDWKPTMYSCATCGKEFEIDTDENTSKLFDEMENHYENDHNELFQEYSNSYESYANEEDIFTWISTKLGLKPRKQTTYGPKEIPDNRPKEKPHLCSPSEIYDHKSEKCIPKYMAPWKLRNESYSKEGRMEDIYHEMLRIVDPDMTGDVNTGYGQSMISDMAQKHNLSEYQIQEIWDSGGTTDIDVSNEFYTSENEKDEYDDLSDWNPKTLKDKILGPSLLPGADWVTKKIMNEEIIEKKPPKIEYLYYKQYPLGRRANVKSHFGKEVSIRTLREAENWWGQVRVKQGYPAWNEMNIINRQRAISDYLRSTVFRESYAKEGEYADRYDDMPTEDLWRRYTALNGSMLNDIHSQNALAYMKKVLIRRGELGESYSKERFYEENAWECSHDDIDDPSGRGDYQCKICGASQNTMNAYADIKGDAMAGKLDKFENYSRWSDVEKQGYDYIKDQYDFSTESYAKEFIEIEEWWTNIGNSRRFELLEKYGYSQSNNFYEDWRFDDLPDILQSAISLDYEGNESYTKEQNGGAGGAGSAGGNGASTPTGNGGEPQANGDGNGEDEEEPSRRIGFGYGRYRNCPKGQVYRDGKCVDEANEGESNLKGNTAQYTVSYYRPDVGGEDDTDITGWNELKDFSKRVGGISRVIHVYRNGKELETTYDDLSRLKQEANEGGRGSGKRGHSGWMKSLEEAGDYKECPNCKVMTEQYGGKCQLCGKKV